MRRSLLAAIIFVSICCALPGSAWAYSVWMHEMLPHRLYPLRDPWMRKPLSGASPETLVAFRRHLYGLLKESHAGMAEQLTGVDDFDAWAFKDFLMLNPAMEVWGIDRSHAGEVQPRVHWLGLASKFPDTDRRNQERFRRDAQREILRDAWDRPLPEDPATLEMGRLGGLSSQAHAHYGLVRHEERSDDPEVLKSKPWLFSIPPDAHTFTEELTQSYTELALLAALWGEEGGDYLAALFAGNAWHHIADVANQIHTVQVGIYDFFFDAKLLEIRENLLSLGGLLYERRGFRNIGIGILRNHHLLSEQLFNDRLRAASEGKGNPGAVDALNALADDDSELAAQLSGTFDAMVRVSPADMLFGEQIVRRIVLESSREGADVYQRIYEAGRPRMRAVGEQVPDDEDGFDTAAWVRDDAEGKAALEAMYALQDRGLKRAATALRIWTRYFREVLSEIPPNARAEARRRIARRLATRYLKYQSALQGRQQNWEPQAPATAAISWGYPIGAAVLLSGIALIVARLRRRR